MTIISKCKKGRLVQMVEIVRSDLKDLLKDPTGFLSAILPDEEAGDDASLDEASGR